jgi:hypothetical protein
MRLFLSSLLLIAACAPGDLAEPEKAVATRDQPILGTLAFDGSCNATHQEFFRNAGFLARTIVSSPAFEQCVRQRVVERYVRCDSDPAGTTAQHTQNALLASRSVNDLVTRCDYGHEAWGRAGVGSTPAYYGNEQFTFSQWSMQHAQMIGLPMCGPEQSYKMNNCREAPYPDGLREVAATLIHENLHQHAYIHDGCTAPGYALWQSMPYLVDSCIVDIVVQSQSACGDICPTRSGDDLSSCRNRGRLQLVDALGASTCSEVYDPGLGGLGAIHDVAGEMTAMEMLPHGQRYGGSAGFNTNYSTDIFKAQGDFDPYRPGEEMVMDWARSSYDRGWMVVGIDALGAGPERTASVATRLEGSLLSHWGDGGTARWLLYRDNQILGVGRYSAVSVWGSGLARDELLVRDPNGLGVLAVVGNFVTRNVMPWGTVFTGAGGSWTLGSGDAVIGQGDLNGDGQTDIILRSTTRIAIITRTGAGGTFETLDTRSIDGADGWWGFWNLGTADQIVAVADVVGDARDEIVIRSPWGFGLLQIPAGGRTPRDIWGAPYGTVLSSTWTLRSTDQASSAGHWFSSTKKSVRLRGTDGLATLRWSGSTTITASISQRMPASGGSWPDLATGGHWAYGHATDQILAVGDFDGDGFDSFVIRSGWGIGIIGRTASSSSLVVLDAVQRDCGPAGEVACHGGLWGSWLVREGDQVVTVLGDGAGGDSLILRGYPTP